MGEKQEEGRGEEEEGGGVEKGKSETGVNNLCL